MGAAAVSVATKACRNASDDIATGSPGDVAIVGRIATAACVTDASSSSTACCKTRSRFVNAEILVRSASTKRFSLWSRA